MKSRTFGRLGVPVSEIGFGAWAIGGTWGKVDDSESKAALHAALDGGVTFIDTADVYGDGHSERLIAEVMKERGGERPFIATKAGRRLPSQAPSGYTLENLTGFINRSLENLDTDVLDLVQLHCPSTDVYYRADIFGHMDHLVSVGKIKNYGVSVERVEEALKAIEFPNVVSVQIIFNPFRQRPADLFFAQAEAKNIAVIARVPLASGLLSGKFTTDTKFESDDHRQFNRNGEAFDVGETFGGVPFEVGLAAVERLRPLVGGDSTMAIMALRWILAFDAITVVIPGAKNVAQANANAAASGLAALPALVREGIDAVYNDMIKPHVHQRW